MVGSQGCEHLVILVYSRSARHGHGLVFGRAAARRR